MARRITGLLVALVVLAACGTTASPSPTLTPSASPAPTVAGFELNRAPANLGCDAMAPGYRQVTFRIDAEAAEPVTATTNTGKQLRTFWSAGFVGGSAADPVVRDSAGQVVAADGDVLAIPDGAWPRLHGYFVCPSTDAVYILDADPA